MANLLCGFEYVIIIEAVSIGRITYDHSFVQLGGWGDGGRPQRASPTQHVKLGGWGDGGRPQRASLTQPISRVNSNKKDSEGPILKPSGFDAGV
jgi:hypothetical protein